MTPDAPTGTPPAASLLDLLLSAPETGAVARIGDCALAVLPPATAGSMPDSVPASAARPAAGRLGKMLARPLLLAARMVLRRPQVRQLALRILKRSPMLYARAYRMMMAANSGGAAPEAGAETVDTLSPRANAILRTLRTLRAAPPRPAGARPRLAFVSPLPPERTGIATYSTELLAELHAHFDIELVAAQAEVTLPAALAHLPVRSVDWFIRHGGEFDQVLYQFGNSPFHSHMFALLERHPGVVVLHDFFLGGALAHAQMSGASPQAWSRALLHSHGYGAVRASESPAGRGQAHKDWPSSLPVLEGATRTIVHSRHARQLAADWFGAGAARTIDVIPHPRTPPPCMDRSVARNAARAALGIPEDCFLVCSFGFVAPNKLTHELLRAWTGSNLHTDRDCALVLVGANHDSPYGVEVEALIRGAGASANIRIAGWTEAEVYRQYLQAADVGVQLRTNAHGESSGAVLDCMNYGLPTIVNANGSMAEFPPDAVWRLPDAFATAELTGALETLRHDAARRAALGAGAVALLDAHFRPAACARQYLATLAQARSETAAQHARWRAALAQVPSTDEAALRRLAARLAEESMATRRQLLVDISDWAQEGTAPDPLAASQLRALLHGARPGLRVEPVFLDTVDGAPCLRQARNAAGRLLGLGWPAQDEPLVDVHPGDLYYAPNAASPAVSGALGARLRADWRSRGIEVTLMLRDAADREACAALAGSADRLLCASEAIAQQLTAQLAAAQPPAAAAAIPRGPDGL